MAKNEDDEKIDFKDDSEYKRLDDLFDESEEMEPKFPNLRKKISFGAEDEFGNVEALIEEVGADVEAYPYDVSLCFVWGDFDTCITFNIEVVGKVETEGEKSALIFDLIQSYDGYAEMDDGTVVNLDRFVQGFVTESEEKTTTKTTDKPVMKLVH
jgi:hypothetical protein